MSLLILLYLSITYFNHSSKRQTSNIGDKKNSFMLNKRFFCLGLGYVKMTREHRSSSKKVPEEIPVRMGCKLDKGCAEEILGGGRTERRW